MKTLRDTFWEEIYNIAVEDKDIVIVCADMGAPALDKFKANLPGQFVNVGIAEQNAIAVASGLALNGKKVFPYAIAPFITYRCYDQTKVMLSGMNLNVNLVGIGAGFSYEDSGPTHHTVEDISVMRILPNMIIYTPSCANEIKQIVKWSISGNGPGYIRLDRQALPNIYDEFTDFSKGFVVSKELKDTNIICTGNMVHNAVLAAGKLSEIGVEVGVIDVFKLPCEHADFINAVSSSKKIFTVEEHVLDGGFGSYILEIINNNNLNVPIKRMGIDFTDGYCYTFGGRAKMQEKYGIDINSIVKTIKNNI